MNLTFFILVLLGVLGVISSLVFAPSNDLFRYYFSFLSFLLIRVSLARNISW